MAPSLFKHASQFHISGPNFVINANEDPVSGFNSTNVGATTRSSKNSSSAESFARTHDSETYASHEIYVHSLLVKKHGLPVWRPDPQGTHLPPEYKASGVQIGDVGFVANDGSFEYVFNITLPSDHPVNRGRTPPGFIPISFSDSLTRTQSTATVSASFDGLTSRCRTVEDKHKPGALISHPKIRRDSTNSPDNAGLGYKIITSAPRGAILVIPEGGLSKDLNNYRDFLDYTQKNAISWYKYMNETLGRQIPNGALYLVTGYDKSNCWGVAAFSNPDREEIIMRFQQNPASIQAEDQGSENSSLGSNGSRWWSPIWSSFMSSGPGSQAQQRQPRSLKWSEKYYWIEDSVIDTSTRSGPESLAMRVPAADTDTGGIPESVRNQCLFIRGYRISLGEKPTNPFAGVVVKAEDVGDLEPEDLMRSRMGGYVPFGLSTYSVSKGSRSAYANSRYDGSVLASHVPELENSKMIHPSDNINDFLLKTDNDLEVALTHDEEWMSLLEETDQNLPDRDTLLARLPLKFRVVSENGRAHLENIDSTATGSNAPEVKSGTPNFFISTSASFMFDAPPEYPDMEGDLTVEEDDEDDSPPVFMPTLTSTRSIFNILLQKSKSRSFKTGGRTSSKRLREKSAHILENKEKRSRYEDGSDLAEESYEEKLPPMYEETPLELESYSAPDPAENPADLQESRISKTRMSVTDTTPAEDVREDSHLGELHNSASTDSLSFLQYDSSAVYPMETPDSHPNTSQSGSNNASVPSVQHTVLQNFFSSLLQTKPRRGLSSASNVSIPQEQTSSSVQSSTPNNSHLNLSAWTPFERKLTQSTVKTTLPLGLPQELVSELDQSDYTEPWPDDDESESASWTSVVPLELVEAADQEGRYLDGILNGAAAESSSQGSDSLPSLAPGIPVAPRLPGQLKRPYHLMQELPPLPVDTGSIIHEQRPSRGTLPIHEPSMGTAPRESTSSSTVMPVAVEETNSTHLPGSGSRSYSSPIWSTAEEEKRAVRKPLPEVPEPRIANLPQDLVPDLHLNEETRRRSIREGKKPARDEHGSESGTTQSHTDTIPADTVNVRRPPPSHAILQHLCTSAIRNGVFGVAVTHRYREKYVSTIYYKPVD